MKTIIFVILSVCFAVSLSVSAPSQASVAKAAPQTHCHVHKEKLKHDWVKIEYGLIRLDKDYLEARQKLFPFSNKTWGGGCVISNDSPKFKKVDYCDKCRSAEWLWKKEKASRKATSPPNRKTTN